MTPVESGTTVVEHAPAKVNIALAVGRAMSTHSAHPGMHPICSWMTTVSLNDELTLRVLDPGSLSRYAILWHADALRRSEIDWAVTSDLTVRAHLALEKHIGRALPVQARLEKRIPVGAGLGGGSSDAAAMLRGLNRLFGLRLAMRDLETIAITLGSDVPYFLYGGHAIVSGVGEVIEPAFAAQAAPPVLHLVVIAPDAICDTGAVYGAFDSTVPFDHEADQAGVRSLLNVDATILRDRTFNDLADAAVRTTPTVAVAREAAAEIAELPVHITGSGSAMFVICDDEMHAAALAAAIRTRAGLAAIAVGSAPGG